MDFRQDLSKPFHAPYQPSVAHYTDHYILLISGSKAFSYAGQRIGVSCISDKLYHRAYPGLTQRYGGGTFGTVFIHRVLYALSSGTSHSAQYALAAMLKAANEDKYNFLDEVKVYGERARRLKEIFLRHGFHLVYDNDLGEPVADGFYFTIGYPGMSSGELAKEPDVLWSKRYLTGNYRKPPGRIAGLHLIHPRPSIRPIGRTHGRLCRKSSCQIGHISPLQRMNAPNSDDASFSVKL